MPTKHFDLRELVQPEVLKEYGEAECWKLIPEHVCDALDAIREAHGRPISINSGPNQHCGIRALDCTVGAPRSDHKVTNPNDARAFDLHSIDLEGLRKLVMEHSEQYGIFRIEDPRATPKWIHCSWYMDPCKAVGKLVVFMP